MKILGVILMAIPLLFLGGCLFKEMGIKYTLYIIRGSILLTAFFVTGAFLLEGAIQ